MPAVGITDGLPPCARDHQAVVLSCSHLARRWVALEHCSDIKLAQSNPMLYREVQVAGSGFWWCP